MAPRGRAEDDVQNESPAERRVPESRLVWFVEALRAELARAGTSGEPATSDREAPREPARWRSAIRAWGWRAADQ